MDPMQWLRDDMESLKEKVDLLAEEVKAMRIEEAKRTGIAVGKATVWSIIVSAGLTILLQIGSVIAQIWFKF